MTIDNMYVYNIAVKRPGKDEVECDTLIWDKLITYDDVKEIASKFRANVMIARVGLYTPYADPPLPIYAEGEPVQSVEEVKEDGLS